jgi:hypothetical protein
MFFHIIHTQKNKVDRLAKVVKYLEHSHLVNNQTFSYDWLP